MKAVDTNVLVRLTARDDPKQTLAAEEFIKTGVWVSHLVLAETLWVLDVVYRRSPKEIGNAVEILLKHRDITIQESDVVFAALDIYRSRPSLGFSDCLILEIAHKAGHLPLGSFDKRLAKLDGVEKI